MVGQSVTASRYVDCVVPCRSVKVEFGYGSLFVWSGELVTKTEPCLSVRDQVKGLRPWLRFARP